MGDNFVESSWSKKDQQFDKTLRPLKIEEFVGQEKIIERLKIFVGAAQKRKEALGHALFSGPPGLGKTTIANIVAKTLGTNLVITSGPAIEKAGDLAGILTNLKEGDVLFIDEIHRLPKCLEEYLYPAMEDFTLDLMIDSGPSARSCQIKLNHFSLIGATTRVGLLSSPLRSRFAFTARLDYYDADSLHKIITRSAKILDMSIEYTAARTIAQRSRGTPRIANNLLRWARDYALMKNVNLVDEKTAIDALNMLLIDSEGLDEMDKKILSLLIHNYSGGPIGLKTLSVALGEEASTIAEVYEPFLILKGFLKRTLRGREATELAYNHMGYNFIKKNIGDKS